MMEEFYENMEQLFDQIIMSEELGTELEKAFDENWYICED